MSEQLKRRLAGMKLAPEETVCFLSHHKAGAGPVALFLHDTICARFGLKPHQVFLDSNDLHDLNELLANHLSKTKVVLLLQTKEVLYRPFVIAEVAKALELGIPVVPVLIERGKYNFEETAGYLGAPDFAMKLEKENPGATKALERFGVDVKKAGAALSERVPMLISKKFDPTASGRIREAALEDIFEEMARVLKNKSEAGSLPAVRMTTNLALAALKSSKDEEEVKSAAEFLLDECGKTIIEEQDYLRTDGLIAKGINEAIVTAVLTMKESPEALGVCLRLMLRLSQAQSNRGPLMKLGAGEAVVSSLRAFGEKDVEIASYGCGVIQNLALNDDNKASLMILGAADAVLSALKAFGGKDAKVAFTGCAAIANLTVGADAYRVPLMKLGAGGVIVSVLKAFGEKEVKVARSACMAIAILALNDDNQLPLMKLGAPQAVISVLKAFGEKDAEVADTGCRAILNLAFYADNQVSLMKLGAGEVVISALKAFGEKDAEVAKSGCEAIQNLASHTDNQVPLMKLGAGEVVVSVLKAFGEKDAEVAKSGCVAIQNLASHTGNDIPLMKLGAPQAVISVLKAFGEKDAEVAKSGCRAIQNLTFTDDTAEQLGVTDLVRKMMESHPDVGGVVEASAAALRLRNLA